jgi:hypothetical protein
MPLTEREPRMEQRIWASVGGGVLLFSTLTVLVVAPGGVAEARQVRVAPPSKEAPAAPEARQPPMALRLRNGHLLAVQRHPPALVELGPRAAAPRGIESPGEVVGGAGQGGAQGVALKIWASGNVASLRDISGIGQGADGIYLLSARSRTLCRLALPLEPGADRFSIAAFWLLPKEVGEGGRLDFRNGRPVVAAEPSSGAKPAVFTLANAGTLTQIQAQ